MCRSDGMPLKDTSYSASDESSVLSDSDIDDELLDSTQADEDSSTFAAAAMETHDKSDSDHDAPMWIACGRTFVFMGIFLAGVIISAITFVSLTKVAKETYQSSYFAAVQTLELSSNATMTTLLTSTQTLSDSLATIAAQGTGFPTVTLTTFDEQASLARMSVNSPLAMWSPLVKSQTQLQEWNNYVASSGSSNVAPAPYNDLLAPTEATSLPMAPVWQSSPELQNLVNFNLYGVKGMTEVTRHVNIAQVPLFSETLGGAFLEALGVAPHHGNKTASNVTAPPTSLLVCPVVDSNQVAGLVQVVVPWTTLVNEPLAGIVAILSNTCGEQFTFLMHENATATYLGKGDWHDDAYASTESKIPLTKFDNHDASDASNFTCGYTLTVYSSDDFYDLHMSKLPYTVTFIMAFIFIMFVLAFFLYDHVLSRHNQEVSRSAMKADKILSSLFPSHVKDRLMTNAKDNKDAKKGGGGNSNTKAAMEMNNLAGFFANEGHHNLDLASKPIADLFPETSILFADIAGFTAWSSQREPAQVFTLLETMFNAFDEAAKRRRVYKVETVGDCYVAVTGVPEPQKDHAVTMCRFAKDCLRSFHKLSRQLETKLGPDTAELDLRVGIYSGQVTGGVLRGERSRFQLFGDTMNTAARMEQSGVKGKIHLSQETVDLLIGAGKTQWITPRIDTVVAKGKGELRTYWLTIGASDAGTVVSGSDNCSTTGMDDVSMTSVSHSQQQEKQEKKKDKALQVTASKTTRLIEWNCEVLIRLLKQVVVRRKILQKRNPNRKADADETLIGEGNVIDEVKEIIDIPTTMFGNVLQDADAYVLPTNVVDQLYDYVSNIAAMYRENPFHNFEHASHVTMSVTKLLSRIVAPSDLQANGDETLHDHTYGITSDPLTQLACVLSALIHDVDHPGVPNATLLKEDSQLATYYKGKSMAEQNSVDLAWHLLMDDSYADLRETIYTTHDGLMRFRQMIVNSVMATDIMDKDLKALRDARWKRAFSEQVVSEENLDDSRNRKATIVIEHLIQASDIAHTMQHWHVYRRWNERFYEECFKAWKEGRADTDPSISWYKGEIGFFDFYIIPLAKKLKDCGVFGVSSDEYLNYATRNRKEWEDRGQEILQEMVQRIQAKYD
ncbi:hypothetical protein MPSEU_000870900 [Mayamaea pseudoterrestris]|nr:hypothetical protein MPSEU_000870900 [Mayamaea pseudoterrestris]